MENSKEDFQKYVSGEITLTPLINIFVYEIKKRWYVLVGETFLENMGDSFVKKKMPLFKDNRLKSENDFNFLGIMFTTTLLDESMLKKMFGQPIKHSEFGENFDRRRKYDYCSYFMKINNRNVHIGFDHRGTSVEIEKGTSAEEAFNIVEELISLYKENI